jgi:hypothetical protein
MAMAGFTCDVFSKLEYILRMELHCWQKEAKQYLAKCGEASHGSLQ